MIWKVSEEVCMLLVASKSHTNFDILRFFAVRDNIALSGLPFARRRFYVLLSGGYITVFIHFYAVRGIVMFLFARRDSQSR